ncbi:MAG: hypothetical protein KME17_30095 [Cyanosarcina radialis HA8281-LM2]|jgi:DNA-binding phage protein|nr:hypothetical protein [Cyanosarcina radialis HA8281-LM2]
MKTANIPTSKSYHEFLIDRLQEPEHAAGFIEAILEEENPEPELLANALMKVVEAYTKVDRLSESAKQHSEKIVQILTKSGSAEIYRFVELIKALGFLIEIKVK